MYVCISSWLQFNYHHYTITLFLLAFGPSTLPLRSMLCQGNIRRCPLFLRIMSRSCDPLCSVPLYSSCVDVSQSLSSSGLLFTLGFHDVGENRQRPRASNAPFLLARMTPPGWPCWCFTIPLVVGTPFHFGVPWRRRKSTTTSEKVDSLQP